jgi:hypothetical protein
VQLSQKGSSQPQKSMFNFQIFIFEKTTVNVSCRPLLRQGNLPKISTKKVIGTTEKFDITIQKGTKILKKSDLKSSDLRCLACLRPGGFMLACAQRASPASAAAAATSIPRP